MTEEGDLRRNIEIAADARRRHWQSDDAPAPSRVWTANFSASAFDFMIVAATCI